MVQLMWNAPPMGTGAILFRYQYHNCFMKYLSILYFIDMHLLICSPHFGLIKLLALFMKVK